MAMCYLVIGFLSFSRSNFLAITLETFSKTQIGYLNIIFISLILTWLSLFIIKPKLNKTTKLVVLIILSICLVLPPLLSVDTTAYWLNADIIYSQNKNPYTTPLKFAQVPTELNNVWWMQTPSPYGPIFLLIISLPWLIGFFNLFVFIYAYKLLALVGFLLSFWLFSKLRQRAKAEPYLDLVFLLNPALIINLVLEGHNEIFIILFLLLFLYFNNQATKSLGALTLAILIKFNAVILWPLTWFKNQKINLKSFLVSSLLLAIVGTIFFTTINLLPQDFFINNIAFINTFCFYRCTPLERLLLPLPDQISLAIKLISFSAIYLIVIYYFIFKKYEPLKFITWILIALFFISTKWLTPWYPTIIIPFSLLISNKKYLLLSALITAYCLLHYLFLI